MTRRASPAAILALLLAAPSLAAAQAGPITAADPISVLEAIRAWGHKAKLETDDEGAPFIAVDRQGIRYWVYFYGCEGADGCRDIQFYTSFDVEAPLDAAWANDWNYAWVAGRVDVSPEGDPGLSYFVTTVGGLTPENFDGVMEVWTVTLDGLIQDISWE